MVQHSQTAQTDVRPMVDGWTGPTAMFNTVLTTPISMLHIHLN